MVIYYYGAIGQNMSFKNPQKILFFRLDACVGDCVVHTFVIRELKKIFPKASLTVATFSPSEIFFQNNPYVDKLIVLPNLSKGFFQPKVLFSLTKMLFASYLQGYDLIIVPNPVMATWRNRLYYSMLKNTLSPSFDYTQHITLSYRHLLEKLGGKDISTDYDIPLTADVQQQAERFIKQHDLQSKKWIVLNPTGSAIQRTLSIQQIQTILTLLTEKNYQTVLLDYKHQFKGLFENTILCESQNILEVATLLQQSTAVISVDTGIVHLADAFHKPLLVLYANDKYSLLHNHLFWASLQANTHTLQGNDKISDISLSSLKTTTDSFLNQLPQ